MASALQVYIEYLNKGLGNVEAGLKTVDTSLRTIGKTAEQLESKLRKVDQVLAGWQRTASLLAGAGVGGLGLLLRNGLKVHSMFEDINLSLEVMLKSKEKADALMRDMVKFAATTPFSLLDLSKAVNQLISFRVEAGNVIPYLRTIGQAAATMKVPIEQAIDALMRLRSGIYQPRMLVPLGINRELLKQYGVQFGNQGQLESSGEQAFQAAMKAMDEQFTGLFGRINKNISGLLNNLGDLITRIWDLIGETVSEKFKGTVSKINDLLGSLIDSERFKAAVRGAMDALIGELEPVMNRVLDYFERLIHYLQENPQALVQAMHKFLEVLKWVLAAVAALTAARGLLALILALTTLVGVLGGGWAAGIGLAVGGGLIGMLIAFKNALDGLGTAITPLSEKIRTVTGDLKELAQQQKDARDKMIESGKAATEQAGKLGELKGPSDEATAAQDALTRSQKDFADAKDVYLGAIDAQIAKLRELQEALQFQMTPEGMLAELQAQAQRGWKGGVPVTPEQYKAQQDARLMAQMGDIIIKGYFEEFTHKEVGPKWRRHAYEQLMKDLGMGELQYSAKMRTLPVEMLPQFPSAEEVGRAWYEKMMQGQRSPVFPDILTTPEARDQAEAAKTREQILQAYSDAQKQSIEQQAGFIAGLGLPPEQPGATPFGGEAASKFEDELLDFADMLDKSEREAADWASKQADAAADLVKATRDEVDRLQRKQAISGEDQSQAILEAQANAYLEAYVNQLQQFIDARTLGDWQLSFQAVQAANQELADEIKAKALAAAQDRVEDAQRRLEIARAQASGDPRYAKALEGEGLIADAQQAMQDLANASDAPQDELLGLQAAALAAVTALWQFAAGLDGLDAKMQNAISAIAAQSQAQLEALLTGIMPPGSLGSGALIGQGAPGSGFANAMRAQAGGGTSAGTWTKTS